MSVQTSSRRVAAASAESNTLVRPEDSGPQISVRHPRGRPPVRASNGEIPVDAVSGAGRTSSRVAGVTPVSFGAPDKCFSRAAALFWAEFGSATTGKQKGASTSKIREDIDSSGISGSAGSRELPESGRIKRKFNTFAFYSPKEFCYRDPVFVKT